MPEPGLRGKLRLGYIVLGALIAIKIAEYLVAIAIPSGAWPFLAILALVGTWPILYYFMHINQLWHPKSRHDE
ncbi:MAG: hypothetical protein HYU83_02870 [Chloroflexi bacterium]|nr:hypothetical protein [Chloroflexota bacterium]